MNIDIETIQPGWTVVDANGEDIGTVIEAEGTEITVKKSGLLGGQINVPTDAVRKSRPVVSRSTGRRETSSRRARSAGARTPAPRLHKDAQSQLVRCERA